MQLKPLSSALLLCSLPFSTAFAGGLDRSGQSIQAFLQPANYAEAGISILDPDVKGTSKILPEKISDMADDYYFVNAAVKVQATDKVSLGLIYDQPYGADAQYSSASNTFGDQKVGTSVEVKTQNLTALIGYQPTENWNIYAGPVWQTVEADIKLRGFAYGGKEKLGTYEIKVDEEPAFGWIAGFAYSIPEIALKTAVTYRSEVKHNAKSHEVLNPVITGLGTLNFTEETTTQAVTPQSVNLDFQTGVTQNTLAFANVRWVHWDQFTVSPPFLKSKGQDLISYDKDQWSANVGVGHKFSDKWSASTTVGWDSGAGNPVTTLGPTEGYWSLSLGAQYSPAANYFIQAGVKHLWLGDAVAQTSGIPVGDFTDNNAWAYGMKIGYRF
ncbi:transporter [Acinetobacter sp. NCu2D-2]|uniref:OmpP1/FadL family transporter n=1 Tax=Acinetobacter sp. NCu2D-2 TaxID=1608473 RepID=UPI0007CDEC2F|nr:outer membrane protein transport protein [Acinetobacter sp. NCu2D-2]ANF81284.1 transporter [Acinetobacter sp. NCu2D-2]